jgi:hypothetical protein
MKALFASLKRFKTPIIALSIALGLAAGAVYAAQTPLTVITPLGPYITGQPSAGTLNFTPAACDASNGNSFPITGREILIVENSGMSAYTVTISSVADFLGRTNDITTYSVGAGDFAAFSFRGGVTGWKQSDGTVHLACSNASILFAVLTTPN